MTRRDGTVTGNVYNKYEADHPLVRWIMAGFQSSLDTLFDEVDPPSVLDVGTGEGIVVHRLACEYPATTFQAVDLNDPDLRRHWAERHRENLHFLAGSAYDLSFASNAFDTILCLEVLEHLSDPGRALAEMVRVAKRTLILSVPREPLWRVLNIARGSYLADWGNTPGHVNHWSRAGFRRFVARFGTVERVQSPVPWTMVRLRVDPPRTRSRR